MHQQRVCDKALSPQTGQCPPKPHHSCLPPSFGDQLFITGVNSWEDLGWLPPGSFMNLAGYFPNRKRLKNERHIFQRFLLVLRENSSFHFLCCITPLWYFKSTTGTLLVTSYPILFLCLLSSTAKASSNLSCFPNSSAPGFTHLKCLARGILST